MTAETPAPVRVALGLLLRDGRVLLACKRGAARFTLPGGKPEAGENALACLRRELLEELGLRLDEADVRPVGRFEAAAANEPGKRVEADVFVVASGAEPEARAEIEALRWQDPAEDADDLAPLLREVLLPLLRTRAL